MNSKPSKLLLALLILAFSAGNLFANQRIVRTINDGWLFSRGGDASVLVNIPHSWNAHDTWDEEPGFWRGVCTYSRSIRINDELAGKRVYVRFEGAYQECSLTVNGKDIGRHKGGFTAFVFDATDAGRTGDNDFVITLDNSHNPDIPPLSADFTFYGGVYRDVELEIVSENHISNTYYASSGVFLTTPVVGETSKVDVSTHLSVAAGRYILRQQVFGPDGAEVVSGNLKIRVKNGGEDLVYSQSLTVPGCRPVSSMSSRRAPVGHAGTHGTLWHMRQALARVSMVGVPLAALRKSFMAKMDSCGHASMHLPHRMQRAMKSSSSCIPGGRSSSSSAKA